MTWDDFDRWAPLSQRGAAAQLVASGLLPEPEATARAARLLSAELPDGIATPLHRLWTVRSTAPERSVVGHLWIRVRPSAHEVEAFVLDVDILPELRGRGWGRSAVLAAERAARDAGASVIRLNVFAHNAAGVRLYDSLGYDVVGWTLTQRLDEPAPAPATGRLVELHPVSAQEYAGRVPRTGGPANGPGTADHRLWLASHGAVPVADVRVRLDRRSDGCHAFVEELLLHDAGPPAEVLGAVGRACQALDALSLTLAVPESFPGRIAETRQLVEAGGFDVAARTRAKTLRPGPAERRD